MGRTTRHLLSSVLLCHTASGTGKAIFTSQFPRFPIQKQVTEDTRTQSLAKRSTYSSHHQEAGHTHLTFSIRILSRLTVSRTRQRRYA